METDKLAEEILVKKIFPNTSRITLEGINYEYKVNPARHKLILEAMQEYYEAKCREKINKIPENIFALVQEWFHKLYIGEATVGGIADAIEFYYEAKLKEELIAFAKWFNKSELSLIRSTIDDYLKQRNNGTI
jgi:hypothetical protein